MIILVAGVGFEGDECRGALYLFLEIATITIPSTAIVIAGATVSPVVPDKKSHTEKTLMIALPKILT